MTRLDSITDRMQLDCKLSAIALRRQGVPVRLDKGVYWVQDWDLLRIKLVLSKARNYAKGDNMINIGDEQDMASTPPKPVKVVDKTIRFMFCGREIMGTICGGVEARNIATVKFRDNDGFITIRDVYYKDILDTEENIINKIKTSKIRSRI